MFLKERRRLGIHTRGSNEQVPGLGRGSGLTVAHVVSTKGLSWDRPSHPSTDQYCHRLPWEEVCLEHGCFL